ncbi:hypothetical protein AB0I60_01220 [Actinosynnema sp. NPDC050436]|uniref:hypothetical protein n=1 Tax=Actinosynnema sp. NPDC050436 TaxID=3155659 RepID=UPI0033F82625
MESVGWNAPGERGWGLSGIDQRVGAAGGSVVVQSGRDVVVGDVTLAAGSPVRACYRHQVERIAPERLLDREAELAELADFARSPQAANRYRWWRAGPWTGKTALLSWFVLHPPEGVRVVSFFVSSRLPGQADRAAFVDALLEQLLTLLDRGVPPLLSDATRESHLHGLLAEAAASCRDRGEALLLVVDGLDEDRGYTTRHDAHSVAALLPATLPAGVRVVVAGRPDPPLPEDLGDRHPLRCAGVVRALAPSPHARASRGEVERDLKRLLAGTSLERDLLGLLVVSGGGLSADDLAGLTGASRWQVREHLETVAGRSFTRRAGDLVPRTEVYLLGHDDLRAAAAELVHDRLPEHRDRLHAWARDHARRGWPAGTPEYLLRGYHAMLVAAGELDRATALCTDPLRHERMLAATGSDATALTQVTATLDARAAAPAADLAAVARLAAHRDHLRDRITRIPPGAPVLLARIGRHDRALALARAITLTERQSEVLAQVAGEFDKAGRADEAAELMEAAIRAARSDHASHQLGRALATVRDAGRAAGSVARESAAAWSTARGGVVPGPAAHVPDELERQAESLAAAAGALVAGGHREHAGRLIRAAIDTARSTVEVHRQADALLAVTEVAVRVGEHDLAVEAARSAEDPYCRHRALAVVTELLVRKGEHALATRTALSIGDPHQRGETLLLVAEALAREGSPDVVGLVEQAIELFRAPTRSPQQNQALMFVAEAVARVGYLEWAAELVEQAIAGAYAVATPVQDGRVLVAGAEALAAAGHARRALELVEGAVEAVGAAADRYRQCEVLLSAAGVVARVGARDRAVALARSAVRISATLPVPQQRGAVQASAAAVLARAGAHESACDTARSLADPVQSSRALVGVAEADHADRAGHLVHEALAVARSITDPYQRAEAVLPVAAALARLGDRAGAVGTARAVADPEQRSRALLAVGAALREAGRGGRTADLAHEVIDLARANPDLDQRCRTVVAVADLAVDVGRADRATRLAVEVVDLARTHGDPYRRGEILISAAAVLGRAGAYEAAIEALRSVTDPYQHGRALVLLVAALSERGDHELAIEVARSIADPRRRGQAWMAAAAAVATGGPEDLAVACAVSALRTGHWQAAPQDLCKVSARAALALFEEATALSRRRA